MSTKAVLDGLESPALVLPSYFGRLLYSPPDLTVTKDDMPQLALYDIADLLHKDFGTSSLSSLGTVSSSLLPIMSFRGSVGPAVTADNKCISLTTKTGRRQVTVEQYLQRMVIDKPKIIVSLADEVISNTTGHNRVRKSVDRTWNWFKTMVNSDELKNSNTKIFGTIVYDPNHKDQLKKMVEFYVKHNVAGMVVGGIHMGESIEYRRQLLQMVRKEVGEDMTLMTQGVEKLEDVLDDLEHSVDIVHTTYCTVLTNSGSALFYNRPLRSQHSQIVSLESKKRQRTEDVDGEDGTSAKKMKTEDGDVSQILSSLHNTGATGDEEDGEGLKIEVSTTPIDKFSINLWDPVYRRDTRPLVPGCTCKSCARHTRAYIHHLLKSKELLAEILLYQHNQHQLQGFFEEVRTAKKENRFDEWVKNTL